MMKDNGSTLENLMRANLRFDLKISVQTFGEPLTLTFGAAFRMFSVSYSLIACEN